MRTLKTFRGRKSTPSRRPKLRQYQTKLQVEPLEERQVLSTLVALTSDGKLITFDSSDPETILSSNRVSGLRRGEDLLGIDVRPATGQVYGLGDTGRLYTIDVYTGQATLKSVLVADPTDTTSPFTKLKGNSFGVDFNPTVDRLRVTNNVDQNLRINVDTGITITDTNLAYISTDPNRRVDPLIVGSAYENPDNDTSTGTTLRGIDAKRDVLVTQNPANDGALTTVGPLGVNTCDVVGFDIDADNTAYASLTPEKSRRHSGKDSFLYTVSLTSGAATLVGKIGRGVKVEALAVLLPAQPVFAVTTANFLISFNSPRPDILTSRVLITGLGAGESIGGIDFRAATGVLYGLGSSGQLYTINTKTGQATASPSLAADPADTLDPFTGLTGSAFGFDFNPVVDRLRIVSDDDQNLRVNVGTGLTLTDTVLAYAATDVNFGQDPNVVASAYANNFAGATATTLRGIDSGLDILVIQNPPNNGTLNTVGALGVDATAVSSFDQSSGGLAFAALTVEGDSNTGFYSIDLNTGAATLIGIIGATSIAGGETVSGMAVAPAVVQFARAQYFAKEDPASAPVGVIRTGDTVSQVTVDVSASNGTATSGSDFTAISTSITFLTGESSKLFTVPILDDNVVESEETVSLQLTTPTGGGGGTLGQRSTANLIIVDDDSRIRRNLQNAFWSHYGDFDWLPKGWHLVDFLP